MSPSITRRVAFLSFRLGGDDGVSIVAESWRHAFRQLGWSTVSVAGSGPVDRTVPGLEIGAHHPPSAAELTKALSDVDLVVVENLLTIPINLPASSVVAEVLAGRPAILHHHDPAWQRKRFSHIDVLPPQDPRWQHVTINCLTQSQFGDRGISATTIYNGFDTAVTPGDRQGERGRLGIGELTKLVVHPVRAIERKNIPAALRLCEQLGATYWLTGRAEEGYEQQLQHLLASAECPVIHQQATSQADLYAACDLVAFPSLWEGFGNPPVEAALYQKPVAVSDYPVASELRELGFDWPRLDEIDLLKAELEEPDQQRLDHNLRVVQKNLGMDDTRNRLEVLIKQALWWA